MPNGNGLLSLIWGGEFQFKDRSVQSLPVIFSAPFLLYDCNANNQALQSGEWVHSEFIPALGWTVIDRYPVYQGRNTLTLAPGWSEQYKLAFQPSTLKAYPLILTLKIWAITMPLSRSGGGSGSSAPAPATTATPSTVPASISSVTLLAANPNRKGATIWNASTATLYVDLDSTANAAASAASFTAALAPGDYYEIPFLYAGPVLGLWTAANGNALITELT